MMLSDREIMFDVARIRADFPILQRRINNKPLIYFDNGASTQKPQQVFDAIKNYNEHHHANIHRGIHTLSQEATQLFEDARKVVQQHIGAAKAHEVIFTSGTTASINMAADLLAKKFLKAGDVVMVTQMEHHSNLLPWMMLCKHYGAQLKYIPVLDNGRLDLDWFKKEISEGVKILAFTHVSNTLGISNPVKEMVATARAYGVITVVDGAQSIPHHVIDVVDLDVDFYCFGAHKVYGPTGIGVLYGKEELLEACEPWQWGGGIISKVSFTEVVLAGLPHKFEAGTPNMEGAVGMAAALKYVTAIGLESIAAHEAGLLKRAEQGIKEIAGLRILAAGEPKSGVLSFVAEGIHPSDIGTLLDQMGIAVRTGHHCTQPLMERFGISGTVRAGFGVYNTNEEVDYFLEGIKKAMKMLQ
jgi:cysteine desulfurase / selenocysteine lyase